MTHGTELLPIGMVSTAHGAPSEWRLTLQRLAAVSDSELAAVDLATLNRWAAQRLPGTETLDIAASLRTLAALAS